MNRTKTDLDKKGYNKVISTYNDRSEGFYRMLFSLIFRFSFRRSIFRAIDSIYFMKTSSKKLRDLLKK